MRLNNWTTKLNDLVESRRLLPFKWGVNDCMLWPADVVNTLTGIDPAEGLRGTYDSALSGMRIAEKAGGLSELISSQLHLQPTSTKFAHRGDVVLFGSPERLCGGVCLGDTAAFVDLEGLKFISMKNVEPLSWRVE